MSLKLHFAADSIGLAAVYLTQLTPKKDQISTNSV